MKFVWDESKSQSNLRKHGVSFQEAAEVYDDPLHLSFLDRRFDYFEERWVTVGQSTRRRVLVVVNLFFDEELEEVVRIISAREATRNEQNQYEGS